MEAAGTSICLVMKAVLLSGRWAGRTRRLGLEQAAKASGDGAEVHVYVKWRWDTSESRQNARMGFLESWMSFSTIIRQSPPAEC